jgi:hypothetical protein
MARGHDDKLKRYSNLEAFERDRARMEREGWHVRATGEGPHPRPATTETSPDEWVTAQGLLMWPVLAVIFLVRVLTAVVTGLVALVSAAAGAARNRQPLYVLWTKE